jgi:hypothetical protein
MIFWKGSAQPRTLTGPTFTYLLHPLLTALRGR